MAAKKKQDDKQPTTPSKPAATGKPKPKLGKVAFMTAHAKAKTLEDLMKATGMGEGAIRERERTYKKHIPELVPLKRKDAPAVAEDTWEAARAIYLKLKPEAATKKASKKASKPG